MLRLMMLTGQGSKARARFQLLDQRNTSPPLVNDLVFYETDIMLGKTSVNTASTDVIRMSAQFIATGRIRLVREGSTPAPISPALLTGAATGRASLVGTVRVAGLLSGAATGRGALAGSITATSAPATDPYFANVSLLLPLDAADGSTIFTDFSPSPLTLTTAGNARIRTAWSKWGGSAGNCDGTGDYATISSPSATLREWWNGGAYSIEAWIRMDAVPASLGSPFIGNMDPVSNVQWWAFGPNDVGTGGKLQFRYWNGSSNSVVGTTTMTTGTDYFMQLIVSGTTIELWLDGALEATATVSGTPQSSASQPFTIGQTDNHGYHGYFDDVRITPGLARPTTVPTAPFPTS
jgi:hypothetical protein